MVKTKHSWQQKETLSKRIGLDPKEIESIAERHRKGEPVDIPIERKSRAVFGYSKAGRTRTRGHVFRVAPDSGIVAEPGQAHMVEVKGHVDIFIGGDLSDPIATFWALDEGEGASFDSERQERARGLAKALVISINSERGEQ